MVQAHRTSSNLLELHPHRDSKVYRVLLHEFGVVRLYRTFSIYISSGDTRCARCNMHQFGEVQTQRTSSNLLKLHPHRDNKVYKFLLYEFGVVRLYRTFSIYIVIGETSCAGCLCTSSGWFKHTEPLRTFSNYILTEILLFAYSRVNVGRLVTCTKWGTKEIKGAYALVRGAHRTSSNLLEPHHYRDSKVCRVLSNEFGVVRLYRTFSIYIVTEIARCAGCLCTCSGWFKHIEPH